MLKKKYQLESWIDPRIEICKVAGIDKGKGSFAKQVINKGDVVVVWGGCIFNSADIQAGKAKMQSLVAISEGVYLGASANDSCEPNPDHFLNHSCDPNLWMIDEVTLVARRDIAKGEEITADYAMWEADESFISTWICICGSSLCRGRVTGRDWQIPELQQQYTNHFSPFINRRITKA